MRRGSYISMSNKSSWLFIRVCKEVHDLSIRRVPNIEIYCFFFFFGEIVVTLSLYSWFRYFFLSKK